MKKIPCLFVRDFISRGHGRGTRAVLTQTVTPGLEWILEGKGTATRKRDGTACMVKDGLLYKRYDAKGGLPAPPLGIPCQPAPDEITGHWPHWIPVDTEPESKWHLAAWESDRLIKEALVNGATYELCGPHFNGNPEGLSSDTFFRHGAEIIGWIVGSADRSFEGLHAYLAVNLIEGIVFWLDGEPRAKIRRDDYGLPWGSKWKRR